MWGAIHFGRGIFWIIINYIDILGFAKFFSSRSLPCWNLLSKRENGVFISQPRKTWAPDAHTNPVPAELCAAALKENGNLKEVWGKGNQREYKETKSPILGRDGEHSCTQSPLLCCLCSQILVLTHPAAPAVAAASKREAQIQI